MYSYYPFGMDACFHAEMLVPVYASMQQVGNDASMPLSVVISGMLHRLWSSIASSSYLKRRLQLFMSLI
jgi:hypothetical protein